MPKKLERKKTFDVFRESSESCSPTANYQLQGVQYGDDYEKMVQFGLSNDDGGGGPTRLPEFDLAARDWRDACLHGKMEVPAGYTYFLDS